MKSIFKTLLFGMFLFVAVGVKAQEASAEYEYAEISAIIPFNGGCDVVVVYSERETEVIQHFKSGSALAIHEEMVKTLGRKTKEGWVVANATIGGVNSSSGFLLKRKK